MSALSVEDNSEEHKPKPILTLRQTQVLHLLEYGLRNKEIAYRMKVTEATVKLHVGQVMKRLGATNRTMAVLYAQRLGLTSNVKFDPDAIGGSLSAPH